jgi:hypothetical protein
VAVQLLAETVPLARASASSSLLESGEVLAAVAPMASISSLMKFISAARWYNRSEMKKMLLILMMLLLPWQAYSAAERNLTHVLGGAGHGPEAVTQHIVEHANHFLHHHDDHDDDDEDDAGVSSTHVDDSQKSFQHLVDFEQGCSMNIISSVAHKPGMPAAMGVAPSVKPDGYSNRTTIPPLPPPRAFA